MKHRTRWFTFMVMAAILFAAFAAPGPAAAAQRAQAGAAADAPTIPWPVHLDGEYCWDGHSCGGVNWYLNRDLTFYDDSGNVGAWRYRSNTLTMQYYAGCYPTYVGYRTGTQFAGEMNCTDGSGGHGTWSAHYVPGAQPATGKSSGLSPAGP